MKQLSVKHLILGEGIPKICVPLVSTNENSLLADAAALALLPADLTEWRADFINGILKAGEVSRLLARLKSVTGSLPLLFTFRTQTFRPTSKITWLLLWKPSSQESRI